MNEKLTRMLQQLLPFLLIGVSVSLLIGLFILFSYLLVWGLIIGTVIWLAALVKNYFFPSNAQVKLNAASGRIIDHDKKD